MSICGRSKRRRRIDRVRRWRRLVRKRLGVTRGVAHDERESRVKMKKQIRLCGKRRHRRQTVGGWGWLHAERKCMLPEDHVARDEKTAGVEVEARISFLRGRVTEEETRGGTRREFMGGGGRDIRIAQATEDMEVRVGGWRAIKGFMRSDVLESCGR